MERLAGTCPRYLRTSTGNDPAFAERIKASRQITLCVCLVLMEISTKLKLIRISQECVALLSRSLVTEFDRGCLRGWNAGCDHAWQSAGMAGPFPRRDGSNPAQRVGEVAGALAVENADGDDAELEEAAEALATEVQSLWEAFSLLCRVEMGSEPDPIPESCCFGCFAATSFIVIYTWLYATVSLSLPTILTTADSDDIR